MPPVSNFSQICRWADIFSASLKADTQNDVAESVGFLNKTAVQKAVCLNVRLPVQEVVSLLAPLLQQQQLPEPIQASCYLARAKADIAAKKLQVIQSQLAEVSQLQLPEPSIQDEAMPDAQPAA